jgi:hypothetical protein
MLYYLQLSIQKWLHVVWKLRFFILFSYYWWGGAKSLGTAKSLSTAATSGLLYKPQMIDEDDFWSNWWNENWQGKPKYSEKICPSATLYTTKSHMTRPGLEPRTAAVGSQRLTAWTMARPMEIKIILSQNIWILWYCKLPWLLSQQEILLQHCVVQLLTLLLQGTVEFFVTLQLVPRTRWFCGLWRKWLAAVLLF